MYADALDEAASRRSASAPPRRLKVVHVVEPLATGPLQSIARICWSLRKGFDFVLVHGQRPDLPAIKRETFPPEVKLIPWHVSRAISPRDDLRAFRQLRETLRVERPDLVHAHSSKAGALARLVGMTMPLKLIYSPRGYAFLRRDVGARTRLLYRALETALGRIPHLTVACGTAEFRQALKVSRRAELIPNMIDMGDFTVAARPARPGEPLTVAMCGEIRPQKNFSLFCEIARRFPRGEARFVWLGGGSPPPGAIPDNLEIAGWLPREVVLARLSRADVFCQTSLWEGLPIALLEAMALGLPVLAWPADGNRELVVEGLTGYTCRSAEEFAARLRSLTADPDLRADLGAAGRDLVARQHDAASLAPRWASLYENYDCYERPV